MQRSPRRRIFWFGLAAIVGGLAGGGALGLAAQRRTDDAASRLAIAPPGCITTLDVSHGGTYSVYLVTRAPSAELTGPCAPAGSIDHHGSAETPAMRLTDATGSEIFLVGAGSEHYSTDTHAGRRVATFQVDGAGTLSLQVARSADGIVLAVGERAHAPARAALPILLVGGGLAVGGPVIGLGMMIGGRRRKVRPQAGPLMVPAAPPSVARPAISPVGPPPSAPRPTPVPPPPPRASGWGDPPG